MGELQVKQVESEVTGLSKIAETYIVKNQQQLELAGGELIRVKTVMQQVNELFDPVIKKAHEAHKEALSSKKKLMDPLENAERKIKSAMSAYALEQQRFARIEQERLRLEAEEKARKERERIEAQALKAIDKGDEEKAEALLEKAECVQAIAPIVAPSYHAPAGVSTRTVWKASVIDPQKVPAYHTGIEIRKIDEGALNRIAQMTKGPSQIPGVQFYEDQVISARTR